MVGIRPILMGNNLNIICLLITFFVVSTNTSSGQYDNDSYHHTANEIKMRLNGPSNPRMAVLHGNSNRMKMRQCTCAFIQPPFYASIFCYIRLNFQENKSLKIKFIHADKIS